MAAAAIAKAAEIKVLETVCIADDGGYPMLIERMDGARITGPQIAWNKAFTAAGHKRSTHLFNTGTGRTGATGQRGIRHPAGASKGGLRCSSAASRSSSTTK